jgi:hypothetical protein
MKDLKAEFISNFFGQDIFAAIVIKKDGNTGVLHANEINVSLTDVEVTQEAMRCVSQVKSKMPPGAAWK